VPHSMLAIFDGPDMHVLDVQLEERQRLVLTVESGQVEHSYLFAMCSRLVTVADSRVGCCLMRRASAESRWSVLVWILR
jgi:hypothetical protein